MVAAAVFALIFIHLEKLKDGERLLKEVSRNELTAL